MPIIDEERTEELIRKLEECREKLDLVRYDMELELQMAPLLDEVYETITSLLEEFE